MYLRAQLETGELALKLAYATIAARVPQRYPGHRLHSAQSRPGKVASPYARNTVLEGPGAEPVTTLAATRGPEAPGAGKLGLAGAGTFPAPGAVPDPRVLLGEQALHHSPVGKDSRLVRSQFPGSLVKLLRRCRRPLICAGANEAQASFGQGRATSRAELGSHWAYAAPSEPMSPRGRAPAGFASGKGTAPSGTALLQPCTTPSEYVAALEEEGSRTAGTLLRSTS
jgi:hypothetical protein